MKTKDVARKCMSCDYIIKKPTGFRRCIVCRRKIAKDKKELRISKAISRKLNSKKYQNSLTKKLKNQAWKLMSLYVRTKDADENGMVACYTCGSISHYKEMQAGHFFHGKLDYDIRNLKPQDSACNMYKSGNLAVYGVKLAKELGIEGLDQLRLDANTKGNNYSIQELEAIIEDLKIKLKDYES